MLTQKELTELNDLQLLMLALSFYLHSYYKENEFAFKVGMELVRRATK